MLDLLRIRDLALIEDAELEFAPGMNALTGETGAGKSFIVRAIDFLTGEPMTADLVRPGKEKAVVEAAFSGPEIPLELAGEEGGLVIRRELSAASGRSRVYVNDHLGSLETLRGLRSALVLHVSQHGQQKLLQPAFQGRVLDSFLPDSGLLAARDAALAALRKILDERARLAERVADLAKQREFLEFQRAEIAKVDPRPGEEDDLLKRKAGLKDRERQEEARGKALDALLGESPLAGRVGELAGCLDALAEFDESFAADRDAAEEFRHLLEGVEMRLRRLAGEDAEDADAIDAIEARLYELAKLKRRLGKSLEEIVGLAREAEENLNFLDSCGLEEKRLAHEEAAAAERLAAALDRLNAARRTAAKALCERLGRELAGLGFSEEARVEFVFDSVALYDPAASGKPARESPAGAAPARGKDDADGGGVLSELRGRLLWVPNPGQPPRPLDKIASGGELSRFLLALTGLQTENARPTLIFDEVDAGIGGRTLIRVGERLRDLAGRQQMILITHWPQLARLADRHFLVRKEIVGGLTYTGCSRLDAAGIRAELARMEGRPASA